MPKCDLNKVAKQLYSNHTSAWVFFCKFAAYFKKHLFLETPLEGWLILETMKLRRFLHMTVN